MSENTNKAKADALAVAQAERLITGYDDTPSTLVVSLRATLREGTKPLWLALVEAEEALRWAMDTYHTGWTAQRMKETEAAIASLRTLLRPEPVTTSSNISERSRA